MPEVISKAEAERSFDGANWRKDHSTYGRRQSKYPWTEWCDGQCRRFSLKADFPGLSTVEVARAAVAHQARYRGMAARTRVISADEFVLMPLGMPAAELEWPGA